MVVLQHDALHRTLWGPASTAGRTRATDAAVYVQLTLLALLGLGCAIDYHKPEAVRLAVAAATTLMYFRSTALFVRLLLFVSCVVLYGDILTPARRLLGAADAPALPTAKLALNCIWLWSSFRLLYAIFRSGALKAKPRGARKQRRTTPAAYAKRSKFA